MATPPLQPFAAAIASLHAAMASVANGDVSGIKALYSHSDDATSFYGWGGYEKGWDAVSRRWDWAGRQFKGGTVSYENVTTTVGAELAYTTDIETFKVDMDGMGRADPVVELRYTHLPARGRGVAAAAPPRQSPGGAARAIDAAEARRGRVTTAQLASAPTSPAGLPP